MANTVRIKRRLAGGAAGAPSSLANAELAFNEQDSVLYYGVGTGGAGGSATSILAIGGPGAMVNLSGTQTVTGNKTFTGSVDLTGSTATALTQLTSDSSTKLATTAYVKGQNYLTANQSITVSGDASGSGTTSITLTLASVGTAGTYTKVTTDVKGRVTSGTTLSATDIPTLTAAKISDFDTQVRTNRLDQMAAPTASVSLNSQKITSLATPTADTDAATKAYVDAARSGLDVKASVRAATTANITLSGAQTIDGVSVIAGDRVLVKDQSAGSTNGIYVAAASTWSRATDADVDAEVHAGMFTFVEEGTANADSGWVLTTNNPIVVGSTALAFAQFSGAGQITAGAGLTKTGNTIDAVGTASRITVNADSIDIAATYVGQTSITTLGTIATGTWNGSTLTVAYGGSGATTLTGVLKGNGTSAFTAAVDGTDYLSPNAIIDGGTF
jgi:phage-related tail fiber protein